MNDTINKSCYKKLLKTNINYKDDISQHRTIHKAKGDEFQNVLLITDSIDFLTNPNLAEDEEQRIYYVSVSRAVDRLFITTSKLSKANRAIIEAKFNIKIIELEKEHQLI